MPLPETAGSNEALDLSDENIWLQDDDDEVEPKEEIERLPEISKYPCTPDRDVILVSKEKLNKFYLGIELNNDVITYNTTETIKGCINLSLPRPCQFSEIILCLEGHERVGFTL